VSAIERKGVGGALSMTIRRGASTLQVSLKPTDMAQGV